MIKIKSLEQEGNLLIIMAEENPTELATKINAELLNNNDVYIDAVKKKRSLDANAYMWKLCDEIAKKINSTREEIYKAAIRAVGVAEDIVIKDKAIDSFSDKWQKKGLGWFCEKIGDSPLRNASIIRAYYGSSSYDSKEMCVLIDYVKADAEELGIPTMRPEELNSLLESWGKNEKPKV